MRLGIDFGTTRTAISIVDRGNFPTVSFHDSDGDLRDHIPSLVALSNDELVYGFDAETAAAQGAPVLRSMKRMLSSAELSGSTAVELGGHSFLLLDILRGFFSYVADRLRHASTAAPLAASELLEAVVGVPAHAHSAQRFFTLEAARLGGFTPLFMLNEPSAAGLEYTHRHGGTVNSKRTRVIVYDLGGGTFDASLVAVDGTSHEVLASYGDNLLGGDDFDEVLALLALDHARETYEDAPTRESIVNADWAELLMECRLAKECLVPQTRWITVPLPKSWKLTPVTIAAADFYERCIPLIESTLATMEPLLARDGDDAMHIGEDVAGLYVVGGASQLPIVSRVLRSTYGRRVHRSPYSGASTAIGLAIACDPDSPYALVDRLSRGLGVFRERHSGAEVSFDPLLPRDLRIEGSHGATVTRTYKAIHNIGCFRFIEYSSLDADGTPRGEVLPLEEVLFPFDATLQGMSPDELSTIPVRHMDVGVMCQERYSVDANGIVTVTLTDLSTGYSLTRSLASRV
ncbi:Hsp70 family protein [Schaalia canis]|uniref:Hsp70 family protein n=1 Tax=Schaalia canis TaxID=100469 RepID=A0A3P1SFW4_9ACTO|nr:Hsp70 family protein [Schaalia canis]RRC96183.1 Hsp70 family protein [Schaalia canis]